MLTLEQKKEYIGEFIEIFEEFLKEKGINIENLEKKDSDFIIDGDDYKKMEKDIGDLLFDYDWDLPDEDEDEFDEF